MNRVLFLIAVAALTFVVILFASRPDLWDKFILWIVGLAGIIIRLINGVFLRLKHLFTNKSEDQTEQEFAHEQKQTRTVDESVG